MRVTDEGAYAGILGLLCRHLVALCITYRLPGQETSEAPEFSAYSGTIVCFNNTYYFLTAGHSLKKLNQALDMGVSVQDCVLADTFGLQSKSAQPIPFDLMNSPRFFVEEDGLDFGLIFIRPFYVDLLAANGIVALYEENWKHQSKVSFDNHFFMLGLPDQFTETIVRRSGNEILIDGSVTPTLIPVTRLAEPPTSVQPTRFPRFVGQINPNMELGSILGMSGGPIFGFSFEPEARYWVVAIQSSWLCKRRITFGCPLPVLGQLTQQFFESFDQSR